MSSSEFTSWRAWFALHPWSDGAAMICMVLARLHGNADVALSDFLPQPPEKPKTGRDLLRIFRDATGS